MIKKLSLIKDEEDEKDIFEVPKIKKLSLIKGETEEDIFKPQNSIDVKEEVSPAEPSLTSFDWTGTKKQIDTLTSELKDYEPIFNKYNITLTDFKKQIETVQLKLKNHFQTYGIKGSEGLKTQESDLINQYNSIIGESKFLYQEYDFKHKGMNKLIEQYNANLPTIEMKAGVGAGAGIGVEFEMGRIQPQIKESGTKDIFDAFRLGASGMYHKTKQYFNSVLPNMIFRDLTLEEATSQYAGMTPEHLKKVNEGNKEKRESYIEKYNQANDRYVDWLREHPELQPRKEWEKGVIDTIKGNPKILLEPAYWGYVAAQSAAFTIGVMGTVLGTTAVTGNPLLGLATGVLVAIPLQSQELYEDLIANGATPEEATKLAIPIGGLIASVEVMGDLPILASVSAPFKKLLFRNINKAVSQKVGASLLKRGLKTFATIEVAETIEEVVQLGIQEATVKTVNENINILENIPETVIHTLIATTPFALVGLGSETQIATQLKKKVTDVNYKNAVRVQLEEAGFIPRMEVEALAYKEETLTGKAYRAETYIPEHGAEIISKMKTAQEKLNYDVSTTGNPVFKEAGKIAESLGIDLNKVPKEDMIWVAKKLNIAQKYGEAKEVKIPKDTIILMEDKEGGYLVLKNVEEYRAGVEERPVIPEEFEKPGVEEEVTVSLEEEGKVEAIWAGEDIGGTSEEIKEGTLKTFEKTSEFLYNKPFGELKRPELNKVLETSKQPLPDDTGEYINKIGTPAKGLELRPTADEHAVYIFGGYERGLLTDSHLLVLDKDVSKAVLTDIIEKYKKARVKEVQTAEVSYKEAQKIVDKEVEKYKKDFVKNFPEIEKILPESAIEKSTSLWLQGHQITDWGPPITILTDGKIQVALDTNKLSFLNKHFPNAEIKATGENQAVLFMEEGKLKAMVMPLRAEEYPFKITGEPTIKKPSEKVRPTIKKISKTEPTVKPTITPEEIAERKRLIKQIHTIKSVKGLTDKEYTQIKRKIKEKYKIPWTTLTRMNLEQLRDVTKSMEGARPKRIGYQKVITLKTEKKIQSLKDNLVEKYQMTEEAYQETLKDLGIRKEPKYVDAKHFITETQGKDIIYRLIDEANILKITEPSRIALEKNPEVKKLADVIDKRVKSEGERTLKDPSDLNSARSYFQILETISGAPFFTLYQDLINTHLENRAGLNHLIAGFDEYRDIIKEEIELKKVEDWILAKSNLKGRPETPANITPKEIELAKKIEGILKGYQSRARTEKFLDNLNNLSAMPQYLQYKKEIDKAKDIYESKGYDDLVKYMETQKWGVIRSGYDPLQVVSAKIRVWKAKGLSMLFGKEHIRVRKDIEYREQDTNIITRLIAYKRQMDNLSVMAPKVRALITLANKNLDKFKNPARVRSNLQVFFRELKGYDRSAGWFERGINRLYSQAMIAIIMGSPPLADRISG